MREPNRGPLRGAVHGSLFTLVETARQAGVDIEEYLTALLTELPAHSARRLGDCLPRAWQLRVQAGQQTRALGLTT